MKKKPYFDLLINAKEINKWSSLFSLRDSTQWIILCDQNLITDLCAKYRVSVSSCELAKYEIPPFIVRHVGLLLVFSGREFVQSHWLFWPSGERCNCEFGESSQLAGVNVGLLQWDWDIHGVLFHKWDKWVLLVF